MRDMIRRKRNRKGFTLAEMLVVVAILIILAGVSFVSVSQYQKNLRLMELDGTAKEIFIAAQNHLSLAKASGDLDRLGDEELGARLSSAPAYAEDDGKGSYYYLIHNAVKGTESYLPEKAGKVCSLLLPYGAVDETVAAGGNYIVVYEKNSGTVVAVLYSGAGNASFGNQTVITFDAEDVPRIEQVYGDANKDERKSYKKGDTTAIVGCYTGAASTAPLPAKELDTPTVEVKNENRLHVIVDDTPFHTDEDQLTLVIYGQTSKTTAKKVLDRSDVNIYAFTQYQFDVTLDDITGDGNLRFTKLLDADANRGFKKSNDSEGNDFIPGENIEIYVIASSKDALATPKKSTVYTVSSLFGDQNDGTTVYIKNLRHLENLGGNISDFKGKLGANGAAAAITAEQKTDITMFSVKNTGADSANTAVFVDLDGKELSASYIYNMTANDQPRHHIYAAADIDYPLVYHGNGNEIKELSIGAQQNHADAGIFGKVENPAADEGEGSRLNASLEVKDLILRNNKIPSSSTAQPTNAGMLVGSASADLTVNGVLAYYHEDTYSEENDSATEVSASGAAGGLIGLVSGGKLTVTNSAAAVYVEGGTAAGGLIGKIEKVQSFSTITQSYAGGHTKEGKYTEAGDDQQGLSGAGRVNVQASDATGYAGGLLGVYTESNLTMDAVYSTASAYAATAANSGSLVGKGVNNPTVTGAVSAVKVGGSDAGGYVIIKKDSDKKPNYYAVGTHNGTAASSDDIAQAILSSNAKRRQATPYDRELLPKNGSTAETDMKKTSYPLYSAGQLAGKLSVDSKTKDSDDSKDLPWFMKEHVGDWVVPSSTESNFKVINGNRLTVRILTESTSNFDYVIKVHGESSKQDVYFRIRTESGNVNVYRSYPVSNWITNYQKDNLAVLPYLYHVEDSKHIDFYLDNIARKDCRFGSIVPSGNTSFLPGEDITINVTSVNDSEWNNIASKEFDEENAVLTNSCFGSIEKNPSDTEMVKDHNDQKIKKINAAFSTAQASTCEDKGLITDGTYYYVQIDNSRHLQNLSSYVSGGYGNDFYTKLAGAIQTDDIYWSGTSTAYTQSFIGELADNNTLKVYGASCQNGWMENKFCPISLNSNKNGLAFTYFGTSCKISNFNIEGNGDAGLFGTLVENLSVRDLNVENVNAKGTNTGVLVGNTDSHKITIRNVNLTTSSGANKVNGTGTTGGFVGSAGGEVDIQNSGINGTTEITSTGTNAGGLVGSASNKVTIDQATFDAQVTVTAEASDAKAGGFIGSTGNQSNTVEIKNSSINQKTTVVASNGYAAGIVAYAGYSVPISITAVKANGDLSTTGSKAAAGFVGFTQGSSLTISGSELNQATVSSNSTDSKAAGLVADAQCAVTINNQTKVNGKLTVTGDGSTGGFVGVATKTVNIENSELNTAEVTSNNGEAAGLVAKASGAVTISGMNLNGKLTVSGKNASGGCIGSTTGNVTIQNTSVKDAIVTSKNSASGGLVGYENSSTVKVSKAKVVGENTQIIAGGNAGGLFGELTASGEMNISDAAASAYIYASGNNAGGLIGALNSSVNREYNQSTSTYTYKANLSRSYYGGRTVNGKYASKTIGSNKYDCNIWGKQAAGGIIGWCEKAAGLEIDKCFNTGSVYSAERSTWGQTPGGFFGSITNGTIKMSSCYSMGKVDGGVKLSDGTVLKGGFIGSTTSNSINLILDITDKNYYLKAFNDSTTDVRGITKDSKGNIFHEPSIDGKFYSISDITTEDIQGLENKDLSKQTFCYDETLSATYPYKNWTKDTDSDEVTYYGDWPEVNLDGAFVYYYPGSSSSFSKQTGGNVTFYRHDGEVFDANLTKDSSSTLNEIQKEKSFGILIDKKEKYITLENMYQYKTQNTDDWSAVNSIEGSSDDTTGGSNKYATLRYLGKTYYLHRITSPKAGSISQLWIQHMVRTGDSYTSDGTYKWTSTATTMWTKVS